MGPDWSVRGDLGVSVAPKIRNSTLVPCHSRCCVDVFDVVFVQGMNLYTFHGQKVHSVLRDMFYQVICF